MLHTYVREGVVVSGEARTGYGENYPSDLPFGLVVGQHDGSISGIHILWRFLIAAVIVPLALRPAMWVPRRRAVPASGPPIAERAVTEWSLSLPQRAFVYGLYGVGLLPMTLIASIVLGGNPLGISELGASLIFGSPILLCFAGGVHSMLRARQVTGDVDSRIQAVLLFAASALVAGAAGILAAI